MSLGPLSTIQCHSSSLQPSTFKPGKHLQSWPCTLLRAGKIIESNMTQQQQQQQQHIQYIEVVIGEGGEEEVRRSEEQFEKNTCSPFDNACTRMTCPRLTWRDLKLLAQDCYQDNCKFSSLTTLNYWVICHYQEHSYRSR